MPWRQSSAFRKASVAGKTAKQPRAILAAAPLTACFLGVGLTLCSLGSGTKPTKCGTLLGTATRIHDDRHPITACSLHGCLGKHRRSCLAATPPLPSPLLQPCSCDGAYSVLCSEGSAVASKLKWCCRPYLPLSRHPIISISLPCPPTSSS